jgi:hypothetical protein
MTPEVSPGGMKMGSVFTLWSFFNVIFVTEFGMPTSEF